MFKFGIIGAGSIAAKFCNAVSYVDDCGVVAVASKSLERAAEFAQRFGVDCYYDSYEQMLKEQSLGAVYIATTHNFHYNNIMLCLDYSVPVLCEKCMVLTKAGAEAVFKKAREKSIFVMEAMWSRFIPAMKKARELIKSGEIGEIVSASYAFGMAADKSHRVYNPEIAGGVMYDLGVYCIEQLTYLIDKPVTNVQASVIRHESGVDETVHIILDFDGCLANVNCSIASKLGCDMYISGTKGRMHLPEAVGARKIVIRYNDGTEKIFEHDYEYEKGFTFEIKAIIACIQSGKIECEVMPHKATIECAEIFDITGKS